MMTIYLRPILMQAYKYKNLYVQVKVQEIKRKKLNSTHVCTQYV